MPKSEHQIPGRVRSIYEFIKAYRDQYSVQMMCRILEVATSDYYDWLFTARLESRARGRPIASADSRIVRREPRDLRRAACLPRSA